jgi:hypothetical protein
LQSLTAIQWWPIPYIIIAVWQKNIKCKGNAAMLFFMHNDIMILAPNIAREWRRERNVLD